MSSGITFTQMRQVVTAEAERIDIVQRALIEAGLRKAPDCGQLHMKAVFEAIDRLIGIVTSDRVIMDRLKQRANDMRRAAAGRAAGA